MTRTRRLLAAAVVILTVGLGLPACSGGDPTTAGASAGENSASGAGSGAPNAGGTAETAAAEPGGTLNMLGTGDVIFLDPNISYYTVDKIVEHMFNRPFFTNPAIEGKTTTAAPDLAAELPTIDNGGISADGKTYTIRIRPGVKWNTSPAREVTADDAVRGLKRTCNPAQPFGGLPDFSELIVGFEDFCAGFAKVSPEPAAMADYMKTHDIDGVSAKDDHTVVYQLNQPATYFVSMMTMAAFSPAPVEYLQYAPASSEQAQNTIANGPYQITSYKPTKSISLERNPAWDPQTDPIRQAYVDKIEINVTGQLESIQQQLETGSANADMQIGGSVPPASLPGLIAKKDPNLNLGTGASLTPYLAFNSVSPNADRALSKVKVRQALSHGINRDSIIQVLGGPKVNPPQTHVLPPSVVGSTDIDLYPYDPEKAKQLLAEAGYPNGFTLKFLYRNATPGNTQAFQTIQQDLAKIGVTAEGAPVPNADFYAKYMTVDGAAERGAWDLSLAGWGADWFGDSAISYFKPLFGGKNSFVPAGRNYGHYDSAEANAMIEKASQAKTVEEAEKLWAKVDEQVMKDAVFFPITSPNVGSYHASQVHNAIFVPALVNFDPTNVWLSKDKQGG